MTTLDTLLIVVCAVFVALLFAGVALFLGAVASLAMGLRQQHEDETDLTPWQGPRRPPDEED
ncbi:MAG: hypothetical protein CMN87_12265 [Stappia sp.]|uniref:hypothetical protein n=1 Tax=Stappia sp. TaxID=1870903 RepID=UPI000C425964|nr:hypothetical protein [Stappia sp.]MAB00137.1 hypothetical protein [Stappia sp.]MBM20776.1 hypothetical protein [Stappia sp.]